MSLTNSSDSESYREATGASDDELQDPEGTGTSEDGAGGTVRAAAHKETIDGSTPTISAESTAATTDKGSEDAQLPRRVLWPRARSTPRS
eukprot:SAG11_NODE_11030_length_788_cov_5.725689_2_plen_90_part_00